MTTVDWFTYRDRAHAVNPTKKRVMSYCGLAPLHVETRTEPAEFIPDAPCVRCLQEVAMVTASEEPLEHALSRGYLASADRTD